MEWSVISAWAGISRLKPINPVNNHIDNFVMLFQIRTYEKILPLWLQITIILTCLAFSALFSGLNLGLMAMDRTELKILCNTGTEQVRFLILWLGIKVYPKRQTKERNFGPNRNSNLLNICIVQLFSDNIKK